MVTFKTKTGPSRFRLLRTRSLQQELNWELYEFVRRVDDPGPLYVPDVPIKKTFAIAAVRDVSG